MKSLKNKVAAITGAGSGIGRSLAVLLAKEGAELALSDIDQARVEETAALVRELGANASAHVLDVSRREAMHAWADTVVKEHDKVNLIFNNAGVALTSTIEGVSYEDFEWIMGINFWGVVYGTKAFLPHLRASGEGHVVNISSLFGLISVPGYAMYNSSKFAVRGFSEALRQELDLEGGVVSCTCVHPGGIKTNIARDGRVSASASGVLGSDVNKLAERVLVTSSDDAATTILGAVRKNQRRVLVGGDARALDLVVRMLPTTYQRIVTASTRRAMRLSSNA